MPNLSFDAGYKWEATYFCQSMSEILQNKIMDTLLSARTESFPAVLTFINEASF